jgi:hypothetical protein
MGNNYIDWNKLEYEVYRIYKYHTERTKEYHKFVNEFEKRLREKRNKKYIEKQKKLKI